MTGRRWWRVALAVGLFGVLEVVFTWVDFEPRAGRLALLVFLCVAVAGLVRDSLGDSGPPWSVRTVRPITTPGADARLGAYVRLIESHLTAATADRGVRDRLAVLCDERLERRRALRRDDPAAEALLGPDLLRDLSGPPRRLARTEIDDYLKRIEAL